MNELREGNATIDRRRSLTKYSTHHETNHAEFFSDNALE